LIDGESYRNNWLLGAASDEDFKLLRPHLTPIELIRGTCVFQAGKPASHVWFPYSGVISVVVGDGDGQTVEVAAVGREGMTGVSLVLGGETMTNEAVVQVGGRGARIEARAFCAVLAAAPALRGIMLRYVLAVYAEISQSAACNQLHAIESRCARRLLTTHNRVDGNAFVLTQEHLAMMLGVTRPSVSGAAGALKKAGLINYSRGIVSILDRPGLENAACECYRLIEDEFARLRGWLRARPCRSGR
jgi:CRP-like cAMP-binding protein